MVEVPGAILLWRGHSCPRKGSVQGYQLRNQTHSVYVSVVSASMLSASITYESTTIFDPHGGHRSVYVGPYFLFC